MTKRITIAFILILTLSLGVCIATRAEGLPESTDTGLAESIEGGSESTDIPGGEDSTEGAESTENNATLPQPDPDFGDTGENYNFFDRVYTAFMAHSGEILGALTLIGSLILAYAYKRGLLPMLKSTLSAIAEAVGSIKASADESGEYSKSLGARLDNTESTLLALTSGIERLSLELEQSRLDKDEREKMKLIMKTQIDMLYNVFMNSSLPEFQKAAMSEKITEMRGELED